MYARISTLFAGIASLIYVMFLVLSETLPSEDATSIADILDIVMIVMGAALFNFFISLISMRKEKAH